MPMSEVKPSRWAIPFCETSRGVVWIMATSKEEALEKFDEDNFDPDFDMVHCGDIETDFYPEDIEGG